MAAESSLVHTGGRSDDLIDGVGCVVCSLATGPCGGEDLHAKYDGIKFVAGVYYDANHSQDTGRVSSLP